MKAYFYDKPGSTDQTIVDCQNYLKEKGLVKTGDYVMLLQFQLKKKENKTW